MRRRIRTSSPCWTSITSGRVSISSRISTSCVQAKSDTCTSRTCPNIPRELLDNTTRFIPGDGNAPITQILRKLVDKGYSGPLSVELFLPRFQQGDPFEVAREIREKAESVMRQARVPCDRRSHERGRGGLDRLKAAFVKNRAA